MGQFLAFLLFLVTLGCSSCAHAQAFHTTRDRQEYGSVVSILSACADGARGGTGVAITSQHIITAKHVVYCDDTNTVRAAAIAASLNDNNDQVALMVDVLLDEGDAVRLKIATEGIFFPEFSPVLPRRLTTGEEVCTIVRGWHKKCGFVSRQQGGLIWIPMRVVRGNSGAPLYDAHGRVRGIVIGGNLLKPEDDFLTLGLSATAWYRLIVKPGPLASFPRGQKI